MLWYRDLPTGAVAVRMHHTLLQGAFNSKFVRWAMQLLSVTVQRGNAEMCRRSGLVISREQGLRYDAVFAVPVLMA